MTLDKGLIKALVQEVVLRVNGQSPGPAAKAAPSALADDKLRFDSIELLSFLMEVEQTVEEKFGQRISLADPESLSGPLKPFESVSRLTDHLHKLLSESPSRSAAQL
jgi:hypothetical protein